MGLCERGDAKQKYKTVHRIIGKIEQKNKKQK